MFLKIQKYVPSPGDDTIMPQDLIAEGNTVSRHGEMFKVQMFHIGHDLLVVINDNPDRRYTVSLASILRCVIALEEVEGMTEAERENFFKGLDEKLEEMKNENNREDSNTGEGGTS